MDHLSDLNNMSISNLIGASNLLKIVLNSDDFVKWLSKQYPHENKVKIFKGYKFFLESAVGSLAATLEYDTSLEISEDYVYSRARFRGVDLNKLPVTCEKTAIMKHIQKRLKVIKSSKDYDQIKEKSEPFSKDILSPIFLIMNNYCTPCTELSYDESLKYSTMWVAQLELTNCDKWIPQGYLLSPLRLRGDPPISESHKDQFKEEFLGYKFTLEYLWHILLEESFEKSSLINLHNATDWMYDRYSRDFFEEKADEQIIRTDLDAFFPIIEKEIIQPLETKNKSLRWNNTFCLNDSYDKTTWASILHYDEKLSLTRDEKINYHLLWYEIELLDASHNAIFNGVPAFVALLAGAVDLKAKFANGEKAIICKFVHPGNSEKNTYSYGVLIETGGSTGFTDYSGWVLCFNCCNDFSGFAGSGHVQAESLIQYYLERDLIHLREMNIEVKSFQEYLAENTTAGRKKDLVSLKAELDITKQISRDLIAEAKGLLVEFITYYTLSKDDLGVVDWNITRNGDQLDITCDGADSYKLIECKVTSNNLDLKKEITKLQKKLMIFKGDKQRIGQFWFYYEPSSDFYKYFRQLQDLYSKDGVIIDDYVVISKRIREEKIWRTKKTDKIQHIFTSKIDETSNRYYSQFNSHWPHPSLPEAFDKSRPESVFNKLLKFFQMNRTKRKK